MESIACVGGTNPLTSFRGPVQSSSLMLVSRVEEAVTKNNVIVATIEKRDKKTERFGIIKMCFRWPKLNFLLLAPQIMFLP